MKKIGLALSGGGARGIAHIGFIKALEESGIQAQIVAGTSAGSIIGAMYAHEIPADEMLRFVEQAVSFKSIKFTNPLKGLTNLSGVENLINEFFQHENIEDLPIPFLTPVVNLISGELEILKKGNIAKAVMASSAVPMVFHPVKIDGNLYVDGGVMLNLPSDLIRDKVDFVIGSNAHPKIPIQTNQISNIWGIAQRSFDLSLYGNMSKSELLCDFEFTPNEIAKFSIFQFLKWKEIYEIGYKEAKKQIKILEENLSKIS